MYGSRIVIADPDESYRKKLKDMLARAGYTVVGEAGDAPAALEVVSRTEPDLIVMDAGLPGSRGLHAARVIEEHRMAPVLLLSSSGDRELVEEAKYSCVYGCLVKPVREPALFAAVEIALANFKRLVKLEQEVKKLRKRLEIKKLVEKAKVVLMERKGCSESEAHRYLQKLSMDKSISLEKVARKIINFYSRAGT